MIIGILITMSLCIATWFARGLHETQKSKTLSANRLAELNRARLIVIELREGKREKYCDQELSPHDLINTKLVSFAEVGTSYCEMKKLLARSAARWYARFYAHCLRTISEECMFDYYLAELPRSLRMAELRVEDLDIVDIDRLRRDCRIRKANNLAKTSIEHISEARVSIGLMERELVIAGAEMDTIRSVTKEQKNWIELLRKKCIVSSAM